LQAQLWSTALGPFLLGAALAARGIVTLFSHV
jgi:hypothetical protein